MEDTYQKCGGCAGTFHNECIETHIENVPRGSPCRSSGAEEVYITNTSTTRSQCSEWKDADTCPYCQWKIWDISAPQTCVMKRSHTDAFLMQYPDLASDHVTKCGKYEPSGYLNDSQQFVLVLEFLRRIDQVPPAISILREITTNLLRQGYVTPQKLVGMVRADVNSFGACGCILS